MSKLADTWKELKPTQKKRLIFALISTVVIVIGLIGYYGKGGRKETVAIDNSKKEEKKSLTINTDLLKKNQMVQAQSELQKAKADLPDIVKKAVTDILKEKESDTKKDEANKEKNKETEQKTAQGKGLGGILTVPPMPKAPTQQTNPFAVAGSQPLPPTAPQAPVKPQIEIIGGIEIVSSKNTPRKKEEPLSGDIKKDEGKEQNKDLNLSKVKEDSKKKVKKLYLPPSFMEATLLSGLDAPTVESGKGDPLPVFLRIKDLAILPNQVKANLKGCFVIAEGYGKLSDERVHLRLTTLSCVNKKGQSVIDQDIKGNVIDADGKIGLKGHVISRAGAALARSTIAGALGGVGDAVKGSSYTSYTSSTGTTQTLNPSDVAFAAIGGGISKASSELQKYFLDFAKQATPIIEVGATRIVTIAVTKGMDIEIKDWTTKE